MTDREMLELAAKAAGLSLDSDDNGNPVRVEWFRGHLRNEYEWNPLTDDGDALRLAVKLQLSADFFDDFIRVGFTPNDNDSDQVAEPSIPDPYAATRRAIVRAAAEIGRSMTDFGK